MPNIANYYIMQNELDNLQWDRNVILAYSVFRIKRRMDEAAKENRQAKEQIPCDNQF